MAGELTHKESDGNAVNVTLSYSVDKGDVVVAEGWLGIADSDGNSGEQIALSVDDAEYQLTVPSGLTVTKGMIVYVTIATLTGHRPQDGAYTTSSGAGKLAFLKATADKDANNVVTGIMIAKGQLLS